VLLAATALPWLIRLALDRTSPPFVRAGLFRPMMIFTGFLVAGFAFGLATGGDRYVAMWEFRPFLYLPIIYVLMTNLFTTRRQYRLLAMVMLLALLVHSVLALDKWRGIPAVEREHLENLVDHGSAMQMSAVLVAAIAAWLLPRSKRMPRWSLLLAAVPVGWIWLVSRRRAAVIGLAVSVILVGVLLARVKPRRFLTIAPLIIIVVIGYLGAFWTSQSAIGFPAQAIKTVIAPNQISQRDQSSNLYRIIENFDISYTIQARPITGLGFGHKFYRPAPLPDISVFPFFEYIPHNSVLWIWIKTGLGGFLAMLYLFGSAVRRGIRTILSTGEARDLLLTVVATAYVIMYLVFAYVDIAWDTRSMVVVAIAMAICSEYARLADGRHEHADEVGVRHDPRLEPEPSSVGASLARTPPGGPSRGDEQRELVIIGGGSER
jgi:O-antigen ligase